MSSLNLTALIREVASEHPDLPAAKIAQLVADRTEQDDLRDFYIVALGSLVVDRIRLDRNCIMNSKQGRSPKVEQRRSWWAGMLRQRVHVGDATWKPLGECGLDDLEFCITERHDQIGALMGQIAKYEVIRDAMLTHGVGTVAELPEGAVEL
jgi:hypothetical protein